VRRRGAFWTFAYAHGEVETPVFMPVARLLRSRPYPRMFYEELGVQILLGNTYHLYLRRELKPSATLEGLHGFMAWPRAILMILAAFRFSA